LYLIIEKKMDSLARNAIIIINDKGNISFWNEAAIHIFGYSHKEAMGENIHQLLTPKKYQEASKKGFEAFQQTGRGEVLDKTLELTAIRKDGCEIQIELYISAIKREGKWNAIGTIREISEQKQTEESLNKSEALTHAILDSSNDAFVGMDADGNIIEWNKKAEKIFGWNRSEVIGRKVSETIIPHAFRVEHEEGIKRFHETEEPAFSGRLVELNALHKNGHLFPIEISVSPLKFKERYIFNAFIRDVTEQKHTDHVLEQKQKMEAVSILGGGVAHDFNNILFSLLGFADLIKSDAGNDEKLLKNINAIITSGKRAEKLVKQMLAFSRQTTQQNSPFPISTYVKNYLTSLRTTVPESIQIIDEIDSNVGNIFGNPSQFQQILQNIIDNACEAISDKGVIKIILSEFVASSEFCSLQLQLNPGTYVKLSITDSGCGIEKKHIEHIFEPFYTVKDFKVRGVGKGNGLGLSLVFGIVQDFHGTIICESVVGSGTTFDLYFPKPAEESEDNWFEES